jgi:hypothetical protein
MHVCLSLGLETSYEQADSQTQTQVRARATPARYR